MRSVEKLTKIMFSVSFVALMLSVSGVFLIFPGGAFAAGEENYAPDRILVRFDPDMRGGDEVAGDDVIMSFPDLVPGLTVIRLPDGMSVEEAIDYYAAMPGVVYAEPDYYLSPDAAPADPYYRAQYGLSNTGQNILKADWSTTDGTYYDRSGESATRGKSGADIRIADAWNITRGSPDIIVAVLDSGVCLTHPDLEACIWTNPNEIPGNGIDDDGNGYIDDVHGWDFYNNDNDPSDLNGHGTHCAGTIAGQWNGAGIAGVAPNVTILPLRFLNERNQGATPLEVAISMEIEAIRYAEAVGASVVSCSFSGSAFSQSEYDAIASSSMLFVCAAGNNKQEVKPYDPDKATTSRYPACHNLPNIVAVAASDYNNKLASFSNYGPSIIDLAAPGDRILSSNMTDEAGRHQWSVKSGTSMSVPFVSGTAALMLSVNPDIDAVTLKCLLAETVDPVFDLRQKTKSGGRLNASAAVAGAVELKNTPLRILDYTETVTVLDGRNALFEISVSGKGAQYRWQIFNQGDWKDISGADSRNYTVSSASLSQNGSVYRCIVTRGNDNVSSGNMTLIVKPFPIVSQPRNVTARVGESATFSIDAGTGVQYKWQKYFGSNWINVSTSPDYTIPAVTLAMNGSVFRCNVTTGYGSVLSETAVLTVLPPQVTYDSAFGSVPENQETAADGSIVLPFEFPAYPGHVFLWWKDGQNNIYLPGTMYTFDKSAVLTAVMADVGEASSSDIPVLIDYLCSDGSDLDKRYDIDGNGIIDGRDLILLQRYLSGSGGLPSP